MALNEDQVAVYKILCDMLAKLLITIALIVAFFIVLNCLIKSTTELDVYKFGALETLLAGSFYVVVRHHFPSEEKKEKKKELKIKTK